MALSDALRGCFRPHGKTGTADLSDDADDAEEADGGARMGRSEGSARKPRSRSVPVGWGGQSDDAKAPSPFGAGKRGKPKK